MGKGKHKGQVIQRSQQVKERQTSIVSHPDGEAIIFGIINPIVLNLHALRERCNHYKAVKNAIAETRSEQKVEVKEIFDRLAEITSIYSDLYAEARSYYAGIPKLLLAYPIFQNIVELNIRRIWKDLTFPLLNDTTCLFEKAMEEVLQNRQELLNYTDAKSGQNFMHLLMEANVPISVHKKIGWVSDGSISLIEKIVPSCLFSQDKSGESPCTIILSKLPLIQDDYENRDGKQKEMLNNQTTDDFYAINCHLPNGEERNILDSVNRILLNKRLSFVAQVVQMSFVFGIAKQKNALCISEAILATIPRYAFILAHKAQMARIAMVQNPERISSLNLPGPLRSVIDNGMGDLFALYTQAPPQQEFVGQDEIVKTLERIESNLIHEIGNILSSFLQRNKKFSESFLYHKNLSDEIAIYRSPLMFILEGGINYFEINNSVKLNEFNNNSELWMIHSIFELLVQNRMNLFSTTNILSRRGEEKQTIVICYETLLFQLAKLSGEKSFRSFKVQKEGSHELYKRITYGDRAVLIYLEKFFTQLSETEQTKILGYEGKNGSTLFTMLCVSASEEFLVAMIALGRDRIDLLGSNSSLLPPIFKALEVKKIATVKYLHDKLNVPLDQIFLYKLPNNKLQYFDLTTFYIYNLSSKDEYQANEQYVLSTVTFLLTGCKIYDKDFLKKTLKDKKLTGTPLAQILRPHLVVEEYKRPQRRIEESTRVLSITGDKQEEDEEDIRGVSEVVVEESEETNDAKTIGINLDNLYSLLGFVLDGDEDCYHAFLRIIDDHSADITSDHLSCWLNIIGKRTVCLGEENYRTLIDIIYSLDPRLFCEQIKDEKIITSKIINNDQEFLSYIYSKIPELFTTCLHNEIFVIVKNSSLEMLLFLSNSTGGISNYVDANDQNILEIIYNLRIGDRALVLEEYVNNIDNNVTFSLMKTVLKLSFSESCNLKFQFFEKLTKDLAETESKYNDLLLEIEHLRENSQAKIESSTAKVLVEGDDIFSLDKVSHVTMNMITQKYSQLEQLKTKVGGLIEVPTNYDLSYVGSNVYLSVLEQVMDRETFAQIKRREPRDLDLRMALDSRDFYNLRLEQIHQLFSQDGFSVNNIVDGRYQNFLTVSLTHKDSNESYDIVFSDKENKMPKRPLWNLDSLVLDCSSEVPVIMSIMNIGMDELLAQLGSAQFILCGTGSKLGERHFMGAIAFPENICVSYQEDLSDSLVPMLQIAKLHKEHYGYDSMRLIHFRTQVTDLENKQELTNSDREILNLSAVKVGMSPLVGEVCNTGFVNGLKGHNSQSQAQVNFL